MQDVFRYICDDLGLYAAVKRDCPRTDPRRENKPDGSWLNRVGSDFPGAISFWKTAGKSKYESSGLLNWHLSVVNGNCKLQIATMPEEILYEDDHQVICKTDVANIKKSIVIDYQGPRPYKAINDGRPNFIRHHKSLRQWYSMAFYTMSDETFANFAPMGAALGLERIAFHHEKIRPGKRTSWPHAHKVEEEMVYVLSGNPDVWINGKLYPAKPGDFFLFPFGSGYAHTVINNSNEVAEVIILGEQDKHEDWVYYPMHPERNQQCKDHGFLWEDPPSREMGKNSGVPGDKSDISHQDFEFQANIASTEPKECGNREDSNRVYYKDYDLARKVGAKRIAFHEVVLPSGYRSSLPHAESLEEEFVYVKKGEVIAWVNGERYSMGAGDAIAFPSGTGISHCLINESGSDVELLFAGELSKKDNKYVYHLNPDLKQENKDYWWHDAPKHEIAGASALPMAN